MILISLLVTSLNLAPAAEPEATPIALSPDARHALVHLRQDDRFTIADCRLDQGATANLRFDTPESLSHCTPGAFLPDSPAMLQRFDDAFVTLLHGELARMRGVRVLGPTVSSMAAAAAIGGVGFFVLPRVFEFSTGSSTPAALTQIATLSASVGALATLSLGYRKHEDGQFEAVLRDLRDSGDDTFLLINHGMSYVRLRDLLARALARAADARP